ncbi:hypothetical protein GCM10027419_45010 [Pandoraea terrae]
MCPFFISIWLMANPWLEILQEALASEIERTKTAVPGAKLRAAVAKIASSRGLEFPPPGVKRFSAFVESFPSQVLLHRQPGSDILVAPVDRPDLITVSSSHAPAPNSRIREDLFKALTKLPMAETGKPHYVPSNNSVLWVKAGEPVPAEAIALPESSLENELAVRKRFAEEVDAAETAKEALLGALAQNSPLQGFSQAIHNFGLIKHWHTFRLGALNSSLRTWATDKAIPWQPDWVQLSEPRSLPLTVPSAPVSVEGKSGLAEIAAQLTQEDLARIHIPLDIVLRLLAKG